MTDEEKARAVALISGGLEISTSKLTNEQREHAANQLLKDMIENPPKWLDPNFDMTTLEPRKWDLPGYDPTADNASSR